MQQQFAPVAKEKSLAFPVKVGEGCRRISIRTHSGWSRSSRTCFPDAFKFTEQGFVTLEVRRPETQEMQRSYERAIAFSVIDTGIGIEPSKFKDVFEAFQQEHGSIDRHYGGTGLGLTIARKFAHMLGGEIHLRSAKGEGSVFTLVLPERLSRGETAEIEGIDAVSVMSSEVSAEYPRADPTHRQKTFVGRIRRR
ncbi:MAG: ATP-binding protein [Nitrospira sp.]